ncbi:hypothetical protein RvY_06710 [Ramazzottius varieornatus]|uniref:Uncharacterized protein n=1 Tax=Ramazzottius varieornatus TaxID=947166 RepID=A0A1D1UZX1_RAMVA|nr:hypothetical protein RvY_06710 [Ramazzottius varieornatus]
MLTATVVKGDIYRNTTAAARPLNDVVDRMVVITTYKPVAEAIVLQAVVVVTKVMMIFYVMLLTTCAIPQYLRKTSRELLKPGFA